MRLACHSTTKGSFTSDRHGPLQYDPGIKAFIINLLVMQMVSLNRIQTLVKAMMGTIMAEATLLRFVLRLHQALEEWEQVGIEKIFSTPAINVDETSLRVDKKNHWIHVYSSGDWTLKFLHRKRGLEDIEDISIIPR